MRHQVLIIDDDESLVGALREFLLRHGYDVDYAGEREEAEVLLTHFNYSLVITDLSLSSLGVEGFDLLRFIASLRKPPKTIVLTGHHESSYEEHAQQTGAELYLRKPISLSALATAAHDLLEGHGVSHFA